MTVDELNEAARVVGELSQRLADLPEKRQEAVSAALALVLAQGFLVEYARHLSKGTDPYDALMATAEGQMLIPESKATLLKLLAGKGTDRKSVDQYVKGKTADDFDPDKLAEKAVPGVTVSGQTILAFKALKERGEAISRVGKLTNLVNRLKQEISKRRLRAAVIGRP